VEALVALVRPGSYYEIHDNYAPHEASESDLGSIVIVYRAKLDEGENKVVTPVNLAQVRTLSLIIVMESAN
jgi:aldose 1-epimerase